MFILNPCLNVGISVKFKSLSSFPCAIKDAEVNMGLLGMFTRFSCPPSSHIAARADWIVGVKNRGDGLGILKADFRPDVLHYFVHVKHKQDAALQVGLVEKWWNYQDLTRGNKILYAPNQLCQQKFLIARPRWFHLVIDIYSCGEYYLLPAVFLTQVFQVNLRDSRDIRFTSDVG